MQADLPSPRRRADPPGSGARAHTGWGDGRQPDVRVVVPRGPLHLACVLGPLRRGGGDPSHVAVGAEVWRASRFPSGPATLRLVPSSSGEVTATAWGPGAQEALHRVPALLGEEDDSTGFAPRHPVLAHAQRTFPGWRVPRTGLVLEALVPAILEQKVTSTEARRAWRYLLLAYGEPAPGPTPRPMWIPPPAAVWARVPSWEWHRAGVDDKRASAIVRAALVAARLEQTCGLAHGEAERVLRLLPGVGVWTAAEVLQRAHGSPDHPSVGDLHVPGMVGWALAAEPWADDERMLELLEPYAGHRFRAVRLVELASGAGLVPSRPRRAPRFSVRDFRGI